MAQIDTSRCLTREELNERADEIYNLSLDNAIKTALALNKREKGTIKFGIEIELPITDKDAKCQPVCSKLRADNPTIHPELTDNVVEIMTEVKDLMTPMTKYDDVVNHLDKIKGDLKNTGYEFLQIGAHPEYDTTFGLNNINKDSTRYQALVDLIDANNVNKFTVFLPNGEKMPMQGFLVVGSATGIHLNVQVPIEDAPIYFDAMNMIQPLLGALTASSPIINRRLTSLHSARSYILRKASKDDEHLQSRLDTFPTNLTDDTLDHVNLDAYNKLINAGVHKWLAKYIGTAFQYHPLIVTEQQLDNKTLTSPTIWWSNTKVKFDAPTNEGVILEMRAIEVSGDSKFQASTFLCALAMIEVLVEQYKKGTPLNSALVNRRNTRTMAKVGPNAELTWQKRIMPIHNIMLELAIDVVEVLKKNGQDPTLINPLFKKAGVLFDHGIKSIPREKTYAENIRDDALEIQPGLIDGDLIERKTVKEVYMKYKI